MLQGAFGASSVLTWDKLSSSTLLWIYKYLIFFKVKNSIKKPMYNLQGIPGKGGGGGGEKK